MSNDSDFYIKQADTQPHIKAELVDGTGDPIDLTNSTVRFKMRAVGEDSLTVEEQASVQDESGGVVTYKWKESDTSTVGYYDAEFEVDYTGKSGPDFEPDESFPNEGYITIRVKEGL